MKNAVILFSGGLDSTTCLAYAKSKGFKCHAISFNYGQRHSAELNAAKKIAAHFDADHHIVEIPIAQLGGSALTDTALDVPDYKGDNTIPVTYVPARNTIFLSFALGWAEVLKADDIFIGVSSVDFSGYPDCRPEYIEAFQKLAKLATKTGVEEGKITINTPLMNLSKAETVKLGLSLGVDYGMTVSCYQADSDGKACGVCDSCALRKKGFDEANLADPTPYI
ncbi:MAG: 7-cyano-7-deazaguanine synthase QueC [Gammaproteobacteria bacterium RIFCSPHIGHO2_12_FULL_45_12]|nr:MAG: 7-cyano-7-deazaguanine synthase QueC [Gammaproteobacteria bacterium RIFCSPHIGHO2_12_FULL_45_12]